jgi:hypothetical protein
MLSNIERYEHIINLLIKENKELKKENAELKHKISKKVEDDPEIEIPFLDVVDEYDAETVILEEINDDVDDDAETEPFEYEAQVPTETEVETEVPTETEVDTEVPTEVETEVPPETEVDTEVPVETEVETEEETKRKWKRKTKNRSFDGYVKKYIPDGQELIMQYKKNEIKCTVDYGLGKFINEDGEPCKSLNMVFQNKCKKLGIKADKDCWKSFKMNGKSIDNLYE